MKSQFIFAFAALFMIASLITEGDCITNLHPAGKVRKVIYWNENILIRLGQLFPTDLLKNQRTEKANRISHFRFSKTLTFKTRIRVKLFLWKWDLFAWESFLYYLRWLDPVILWGYHPTLKFSGIPTFTLIISLTYSMDNILINLQYSIKFLAIGVNVTWL